MNPLTFRAILLALSFRREITYILLLFFAILLLPIFVVTLVTNTGLPVVSDQLATRNLHNHTIQIHDPTGKVIATIQAETIWPIHGVVTLAFGASDLPYQPLHTGIDIAGKNGDSVTAFMKGKVIYIGNLSWGYGNHIIIDHGNNITSLYGHLSEVDVKQEQEVQPGDIIGKEGQTGWATGPHVHFEIRVFGVPVNPRTFVADNP
ncbi:MAG TPA: M23 family metallopeptidase [Candidatus Sulfotelmatobacter sp.]|jgi:murein DD-endopeptidase MepM/ murein hydrolase activator NlpD|nr:M23 family metallopeptidase [Candidatus Sulfotelmatobacter sp.]